MKKTRRVVSALFLVIATGAPYVAAALMGDRVQEPSAALWPMDDFQS